MSHANRVIIISGASGSGKTTLVNHLLTYQSTLNLNFSVSACTRKKRQLETSGKHYIFLSKLEFKNKIASNEFLEWEEVYNGHFYGTLKDSTNKILNAGKNILFDLDVKGAQKIKDYFQNQALSIFIQPPSLALARARLINRGTDSGKELNMRLSKIKYEMELGQKMDYQLLNGDLDIAQKEIYNLVKNFLDL